MKKTLRVYHESGYWHGNGYYERYNAKGITYHAEKFDFFEIDENDNWIKELIRWNRYYKTQNGKKQYSLLKLYCMKMLNQERFLYLSIGLN
jgi:hypothetical protein